MSDYFQSDKFFEDYFTLMAGISLVNWAPCKYKPEFEYFFKSIIENTHAIESVHAFETRVFHRYENLEISVNIGVNCYRYNPKFDKLN